MLPQPAPESAEVALRRMFGGAFVDWLLSTDGKSALSPQQESVADAVHRASVGIPDNAPVPAYLRLGHLLTSDPETQKPLLLQLRLAAGGTEEAIPEPSDDEALDAMRAWAARNFGGLLLRGNSLLLGWGGPVSERLTRAVAEDPTLPFGPTDTATDSIYLKNSAGGASGVQLAAVGPGIVTAAYRRAASSNPKPQFNDLLAELPPALTAARDVFAGRTVQARAHAGLTGVLLPEGMTSITTPWGRVRASHSGDNPMSSKQALTLTLEDGSQLVSVDSGDLTIEAMVPWSAEISAPPSGDALPRLHPPTSYSTLQRRLDDVRLAFALSIADEQVPVMLPAWQHVDDPLSAMASYYTVELAALRQRTPTRLSVEQAEEWRRWITLLDGLPLENLGQAPQRLLRAITERRDPVDALIDAVIVWEAIFGTHNEITFRVCGSLARLIHQTVDDRLAFVDSAKKIYTMRSQIVHGSNDLKPEKLAAAQDQAVRIAIQALRALVEERSDLLEINSSSKRSDRIMLE